MWKCRDFFSNVLYHEEFHRFVGIYRCSICNAVSFVAAIAVVWLFAVIYLVGEKHRE